MKKPIIICTIEGTYSIISRQDIVVNVMTVSDIIRKKAPYGTSDLIIVKATTEEREKLSNSGLPYSIVYPNKDMIDSFYTKNFEWMHMSNLVEYSVKENFEITYKCILEGYINHVQNTYLQNESKICVSVKDCPEPFEMIDYVYPMILEEAQEYEVNEE